MTVGELANISYYTKNTDTDLIDWQVKVYTESDEKWYGYRINYNRPDNPDNEWHQSNISSLGISDIYDKVAGAYISSSTDLDAEKILFVDIIAGYASNSPAVDSYLDGVQIELTNSDVVTLDLAANPTTVWVDDNYCYGCANDGHIWGYDAFDNIQDGIDAVEGSTVNVAAGTYQEQVVINKSLALQGNGDPTIIAPESLSAFKLPESSKWWEPVVFAFGVKLSQENEKLAKDNNVAVFHSDVIYRLIEDHQKWGHEKKEREMYKFLKSIIRPGQVKVLAGYVFRQENSNWSRVRR